MPAASGPRLCVNRTECQEVAAREARAHEYLWCSQNEEGMEALVSYTCHSLVCT